MRPRYFLILILVLTLFAVFVDIPKKITLGNIFFERPDVGRELEVRLGLDLSGGSHLVFEADMSGVEASDQASAHEAAKETVERRVNLFGVSEPVVQTSRAGESYRLIVELAGVTDTTQAVSLIGQTAQLVFAEITEATPSAIPVPTSLSGRDLARAQVQFDSQTGKPIVGLQFNQEGAKKFTEITERNIGKPVAILLDNNIVSAPTVQEKISGGEAVITGDFTINQVRQIVALLNSGALPVPLTLVEQRTIGPTLGEISIQKSIMAGAVGITAVALFMIFYYGRLGIVSVFGLLIYGLLTFALIKLIPIVLTLPGIAGFLLSVGMAVDSNILIFERFKEELRRGLDFRAALEAGFGRAWDSIRDANIATLITSFILFNPLNWNFLHTSGPVRGFAATLALGVIMSLFTGIVVTRTLLRVFARK